MGSDLLKLEKNIFIYQEQQYMLEDFFTVEFYAYSDSAAEKYATGECFDNIIFLNFIQNTLVLKHFMEMNKIKRLEIVQGDQLLTAYALDAAKLSGITVDIRLTRRMQYCAWFGKCMLRLTELYLIYLQIVQKRKDRRVDLTKNVAVIRTSAASKKIHPAQDREMFIEVKPGVGDLYSFFRRRERIRDVRLGYTEAVRLYYALKGAMCGWEMEHTVKFALRFYAKRLVHTCFYGKIIERLLLLPWEGDFITGNNLDAYALQEERKAKEAGMKTVCIPHGLEYGFKFPYGFTCDVFYTTSARAAGHLNALYRTEKFIFDAKIAKEMFSMGECVKKDSSKVVFFSEPREPWVNVDILNKLYIKLKENGIKLYIKHHPKDDLSDYEQFKGKIEEITDLKEAVYGNICVSRKSTVLLESVYNQGIPAAIITNEKDRAIFESFPSLHDEKIGVFYEVDELVDWIEGTMAESEER